MRSTLLGCLRGRCRLLPGLLLGLFGCAHPSPPPPQRIPTPLPPVTAHEDEKAQNPALAALELELAAETPMELSVEAAALAALHRNPDLSVQRHATEIQDAFATIARGAYDLELFGDAEVQQERSEETARATGERFDVDGHATDSALGLRQRLPTGTTLELSLEHRLTDSNRTPRQQRARVGLSVSQALLRGFGPSVNLATIRQADLSHQISLFELQGYTQALLATTEVAYWDYVLAERAIAIHKDSVRVARRQRQEISQQIAVGTLPRTEAATARAEVALREQELIDARSALEEARLRLLRSAGLPLKQALLATTQPTVQPFELDGDEIHLAVAQERRPELNEAHLRIEQRRLETVKTENGVLPRLDFFVALGKTGFSERFVGAFGALRRKNYDVWAGISLSQLFQNRASEGAHRVAIVSHRQAQQSLENLRQQVELEVRLALNEVRRSRQQIEASAATTVLQAEKVAAEEGRFQVGEGTALLLAQAQRDLLSSRLAEVKAVVDYRTALVRLFLAEGSLLARRGLALGR